MSATAAMAAISATAKAGVIGSRAPDSRLRTTAVIRIHDAVSSRSTIEFLRPSLLVGDASASGWNDPIVMRVAVSALGLMWHASQREVASSAAAALLDPAAADEGLPEGETGDSVTMTREGESLT